MIPTALNPERIGKSVLGLFGYVHGLYDLLSYSIKSLGLLAKAPIRQVFKKQIYFTGIEALAPITAIATLSGIVITTQINSLAGHDIGLTAKIMLWVVVRELGPLLTAMVIIARSSSATASELATMTIRGEIDSLRRMGIHPGDYLVLPRIAGITLSVITLTFYFQMTAIIMGYAFASLMGYLPFIKSMGSIVSILSMKEVLASLAKTAAFGLVISSTSCYFGLRARASPTAVPQAATGAVMRNLLTIFVLDGILTYAFFVYGYSRP